MWHFKCRLEMMFQGGGVHRQRILLWLRLIDLKDQNFKDSPFVS